MSFRGSFLMIIGCALVTCGCGNQPATTNTETKASPVATSTATPAAFAGVRGTYAKDCQNCHGVDAVGGRVKLEDGKTLKVPSFRAGHALRHPYSEFRRQIMEAGDGMPAFKGKLSQQQADELVRMIRQQFQPGHTPQPEKAKE